MGSKLLCAVTVALAVLVGAAAPGQADVTSGDRIQLKTKQMKGTWQDMHPLGKKGAFWYNRGSKKATVSVYNVTGKGSKYGFYVAELTVYNDTTTRSNFNSPLEVRIGVHGKGVKTYDMEWTGSDEIPKSCDAEIGVGLGGSVGPVDASVATATYKLCGGGTKITSTKVSKHPEVHFKLDKFQNLVKGQFDILVKVNKKYTPDFRFDVITPNDVKDDSKAGWKNQSHYQHVSSDTYKKH